MLMIFQKNMTTWVINMIRMPFTAIFHTAPNCFLLLPFVSLENNFSIDNQYVIQNCSENDTPCFGNKRKQF